MEVELELDVVDDAEDRAGFGNGHTEVFELEVGRREAGDVVAVDLTVDRPGGGMGNAVDGQVPDELEGLLAGRGQRRRQTLDLGDVELGLREARGVDRVALDESVAPITVALERCQVDDELGLVRDDLAVRAEDDATGNRARSYNSAASLKVSRNR